MMEWIVPMLWLRIWKSSLTLICTESSLQLSHIFIWCCNRFDPSQTYNTCMSGKDEICSGSSTLLKIIAPFSHCRMGITIVTRYSFHFFIKFHGLMAISDQKLNKGTQTSFRWIFYHKWHFSSVTMLRKQEKQKNSVAMVTKLWLRGSNVFLLSNPSKCNFIQACYVFLNYWSYGLFCYYTFDICHGSSCLTEKYNINSIVQSILWI